MPETRGIDARARTWLGRAVLVLLGLAAGVVLVELVARLVQPPGSAELLFNAPDNAPEGLYQTDPVLGWAPTPGFTGTMRAPGYAVPLRINALGLRGPPVASSAPAWLLLGDSFAFAAQVSEADSTAERLAVRFGTAVHNAGADGYSTWQAAERYRLLRQHARYERVVLLFFTGNDFTENRYFRSRKREYAARPGGRALTSGAPPWQRLLSRNSVVYGWWRMRQRAARLARSDDPERNRWAQELALFTRRGQQTWRRELDDETRNALAMLEQLVRTDRVPLLVAVAPPAFQIDVRKREATFSLVGLDPAEAAVEGPGQRALALAASVGVPTCDLAPPLAAAHQAGQQVYLDWDGHWTAAGHAVVARAIADCLSPPGPSGAP